MATQEATDDDLAFIRLMEQIEAQGQLGDVSGVAPAADVAVKSTDEEEHEYDWLN